MMSRSVRAIQTTIVFLLLAVTGVTAQIPLFEYEQALHAIPVSNLDFILSAIDLGMTQPEFPAEQLMQLLHRLETHPAASYEKEALLMVLAHGMKDGLPVDGMINMALEGLARSVPLPQITRGLEVRLILLTETRDLLYSKNIFSAPQGSPRTVDSAIPTSQFNQLVLNIAEAIGEFLEGGGSPFDGHVVFAEVRERLIRLINVTLENEDVELVLDRIEPSDLTQIALAAVS